MYPKIKRFILLTLFLMIMNVFHVYSADTQADESKGASESVQNIAVEQGKADNTADQYKLLDILGIIDEQQQLEINTGVTRAQMAMYLVRFLNMNDLAEASDTTLPFQDISSDSPEKGSIAVAYNLGLFKGITGKAFEPDAALTIKQAIKMIMTALGYDIFANQLGGYPTGYLSVAQQSKLLNTVNSKWDDNLTIGELCKLLNNALEIELVQMTEYGFKSKYSTIKNKTVLTEKFHIEKMRGLVTATKNANLKGNYSIANDEVEIDQVRYKVGKTNAKELLGYNVIFYVDIEKTNDGNTILYVEQDKSKNDILTLKADDIISVNGSLENMTIKYFKDSKEENTVTSSLASYIKVIYNGREFINIDRDIFNISSGSIAFFSLSENGVYDLAIISEFTDYVVSGIDALNGVIYDKYDKTPVTVGNDGDYDVILQEKSGSIIDGDIFKNIKVGNILSVAQSKDGKVIKLISSSDSVSGKVSEIGSDGKVAINGNLYNISKYLDLEKLNITIGKNMTFYLDAEDKIADANIEKDQSYQYGYLAEFSVSERISSLAEFIIVNSKGKRIETSVSDKVVYNGEKTDCKELLNSKNRKNFIDSSGNFIPQLIYYKLNEQGNVDEFFSAEILTNTAYNTTKFSLNKSYINAKYVVGYGGFNSFYYVTDCSYIADNKTIFFLVPVDAKDYESYKVATNISNLYTDMFDVSVYDAGEDRKAKAVVMRIRGDSQGSWGGLDEPAQTVMVDNVAQAVNDDGDVIYKLNAYGYKMAGDLSSGYRKMALNFVNIKTQNLELYTGDYQVLSSDPETPKTYMPWQLKRGDIIQCRINHKGEIYKMMMLLRATQLPGSFSSRLVGYGAIAMFYGRVVETVKGVTIINPFGSGTDGSREKAFQLTGKSIVMYDSKNDKIGVIKGDMLCQDDKLYTTNIVWNCFVIR